MSHVLWSEIQKGMEDDLVMQRVVQALKWMSEGYELQLGGRTVAMTQHINGGPFLAMKATRHEGDKELEPVALGLDCDLGILYSFIKPLSDKDWTLIAGSVALTEINRSRTRR